jgi:hypothetical protein
VYTKDPYSTISTMMLIGAENADHDAREVAITIEKACRVEGSWSWSCSGVLGPPSALWRSAYSGLVLCKLLIGQRGR